MLLPHPPSWFSSAHAGLPLAQVAPWEETPMPPPPPAPQRAMSFSDLQQSMHAYQTGEIKDNGFRNGTLIFLAVLGLVALILHLRQRHKNAGPPDSLARLAWELSRQIRFPFGSRFMLFWVGRSTKTPFASLLVSATLFDRAVTDWSHRHTFSVARHWGRTRLNRLRAQLFA